MTGNLDTVVKDLLQAALPGLFGGTDPPVKLTIFNVQFEVDPQSADAMASKPRPEDCTDDFPFDLNNPAGPYTLTQPPYPGPRRVYMTTDFLHDRIPLRDSEVLWDEVDSRKFSLALRPTRELANITGVQVLYGVTAVFSTIGAVQTLNVQLQSSEVVKLEHAEVLALGVIELNRQFLVDKAQATYEEGNYGAAIEIKHLKLVKGTSPNADTRLLTLQVDLELKANRALAEEEGKPIKRIRTPGRPVDPNRPINIDFEVEA
jgi:hypothetical protein